MLDRARISEEAAECRSLGDVMKWAFAQQPPGEIIEVVPLDEFTC